MPHSTGWRGRRDERTPKATPLGEVVEGLLRERAFARGMPIGQLAAEWTTIVGPRLGAESAPVSLEHRVLVVAASTGPWGAQVRFLGDQIKERANHALGEGSVETVRVIVKQQPRKAL